MGFPETSTELTKPSQPIGPEGGHLEQFDNTETLTVKYQLSEEMLNQWPGITREVAEYLVVNCPSPEALPFAIEQVQVLLSESPGALNDPDLMIFELDECLAQGERAGIAARQKNLETEQATGRELDTTIEVLMKEIQTAALEGGAESGTEIVQFALAYLDNPENEVPDEIRANLRPQFAAFQAMIDLAATDADRDLITAKINAIDFGQPLPSVGLFIETEILADENLSESFRDEVATKFNIPNPRIKTGGQVNQTLDARGPEGKPLYTPENPVSISDHTQAYEKPDGSRAVVVDMGDGRSREIPWNRNEADDVIGTKISLVKIWAQNEWGGQTDFFGESIDIETDILSQTDPQKLAKVKNVMNALFGGTRGFDAVIVQDNEAHFLGWFNQFTATKGDAMEGDFDKDIAVANRTNLGFHPNGDPQQVDYDILREAAKYAKGQFGGGEPNYYALQQHLNELFPGRVPLTGENIETSSTDAE